MCSLLCYTSPFSSTSVFNDATRHKFRNNVYTLEDLKWDKTH